MAESERKMVERVWLVWVWCMCVCVWVRLEESVKGALAIASKGCKLRAGRLDWKRERKWCGS